MVFDWLVSVDEFFMVIVVVFEEGFEGSMVYDVVLEFVDYYVGLECIYIIGVLVLVEDV